MVQMRESLGSALVARVPRVGLSRLVGTAIGVVVTAIGAWWVVRVPPPPVEQSIEMAPPSTVVGSIDIGSIDIGSIDIGSIVVHVAGEVITPGVYELPAGSRLIDAIEAAGGSTSRADTDAINLAMPVSDAQQVLVPRKGARRSSPQGGGGNAAATDSRVNLNTASATELETLPGVGPQTAQAIITHRNERGPFLSVDELLDVPGIGPAKLAALRERVRL
jgi:competence protein ComEA